MDSLTSDECLLETGVPLDIGEGEETERTATDDGIKLLDLLLILDNNLLDLYDDYIFVKFTTIALERIQSKNKE